uniref:site-specific integrase n=1 Tax=Candidatus Fimivicinus sp. TaxID=3056640 RepID=UPI0040274551
MAIKVSKKYPHAFFERGSWCHRTKVLNPDYSVKYGKKTGFKTDEEAEKSYQLCLEEFEKKRKAHKVRQNEDILFGDYLLLWFQSVFSERIEASTRFLTAYVLESILFPNIDAKMELRMTNSEYLDTVLTKASHYSQSAGNKCRELLYIAFKDAVEGGWITNNPVEGTKRYRRPDATVRILKKNDLKIFLEEAYSRNWYLEILLGLYLGLRKGEILGLRFTDFDMDNGTVLIQRQLVNEVEIDEDTLKPKAYKLVIKPPKTEKAFRRLPVPNVILEEVNKRAAWVEIMKKKYGSNYNDQGAICCQENGNYRGPNSLINEIKKICKKNGLPIISVHSLRHMFATIMLERGLPLAKVSALLGHQSVNTTFEFYLGVMEDEDKAIEFVNDNFKPDDVKKPKCIEMRC